LLGAGLFCCAACPANRTPFNVEFFASWAGQPIGCDESERSLTDLRFYVSEVVLIDTSGIEHPLVLTGDERWQQKGVALIDLENGEGRCVNGSRETNTTLSGMTASVDVQSLRFTVGVPFELNHANPLLADAPLDDAAMHWHWRSGYKFLRAGVATASDGFWLHLGSSACRGTVRNISACGSPNRVTVELDGFSPQNKRINVDLSALFEGVNFDDAMRSDCSSGPSESACIAPFAALGLAFANNRDRPTPKAVFRVEK
jgi:uncharacterized repeat protein (TIGR04052 family)